MRRWFNKRIDKRQSYKELGDQVNKTLCALQQQSDKPWVLLFGPQGSGKTSLLKHVFPQPVTRDQKSLDTIIPTRSIDWWYNDDFIFIDTAGKYGFADPSEPQAFDYWQQFLSLIRKKPLDSACFIIDAPSLLQSDTTSFNQLLARFETHTQLLMQSWSGLRLNILVSQCDHLPGFAEFFNNLSSEDQKHPFGLSFNSNSQDQDIETLFKTQFANFLQGINQRLITRLHYEPNRNRRIKIYDFPLQLDFLKSRLASLVGQLPQSELRLDNIFFCSSEQSDKTVNLLLDKLYSALHLPVRTEIPLIKNQQALFITDMVEKLSQFKKPVKSKVEVVKVKKSAGWRIISYPLVLGIILLATLTLHQNYQTNLATINRVAAMLATADEDQLLSNLDTLHAIKQNLDQSQDAKNIGFNVTKTLKNKANSAYNRYLQNQFMSYLQAILVNQLEIPDSSDAQLYQTLKIYLMFSHPSHKNPDEISEWFNNWWQKQYPDNTEKQQQLKSYLSQALQYSGIGWPQQSKLVNQVRQHLLHDGLVALIFELLNEANPGDSHDLQDYPPVEGITLDNIVFPKLYSKTLFSDINEKQIPLLAKTLFFDEDWVLGESNLKRKKLKTLVIELQGTYQTRYLKQWQQNLSAVKFDKATTLKQQISQINLITNSQSPLWDIYRSALKAASIEENPLDNAGTDKTLKQLADYLKAISSQPSPLKAAYDSAVARFDNNNDAITQLLNTSNQLAEPMKSWCIDIAGNSWAIILGDAAAYLNTLWKTNVLPVYDKQIKGRYPLDKTAKKDISITNFNKFFGPGGIMQIYFNAISPFIDTMDEQWTWQKLDNQALPLPKKRLKALLQASSIQKLFYSDQLRLLALRFELKPLSLSDNAQQFLLNIGGEMMRYLQGDQKARNFVWPGEDGNFVTMRFKTDKGSTPTLTTTGPWAWLRLLDQSTIAAGNNPQSFKLTFQLKGNRAVYELTTRNPVNPYDSDLLSQFRLYPAP